MVPEALHSSFEAIARVLSDSPAPLALKSLRKALGAHASALPGALDARTAFLWPKYRRVERYWHLEPGAFVRERILEITADTAMAKKDLIRAANQRGHNCGAKFAETVIATLAKEGLLKTAKTVSLTALYYNPSSPGGLVRTSLANLAERLSLLHIDERELRALIGEKPTGATKAPAQQTPVPMPLSDRIVEAARRLQPAPAVPVTIQSLRAALAGVPKPDFDQAVLSLADGQTIYLTTHDHGWALSEPERDQLVWDGGQKLYVAVTLRD